jgi:hypothetical protein
MRWSIERTCSECALGVVEITGIDGIEGRDPIRGGASLS